MNPAIARCIEDVDRFLLRMAELGRRIREVPVASEWSGAGLVPALDRSPGIVLKSDACLELGGPTCGSCAMLLYGADSHGRSGDRITLVGSDIGESSAAQLPFGQVVIVRGNALTEDDYREMVQERIVLRAMNGYMVKSTADRIWSRVSRDAARDGFCFRTLGATLVRGVKSRISSACTVEVVFVTSSTEDVEELSPIAERAREACEAMWEAFWQKRGIDMRSCAPGLHCGSCDDHDTCLEIRKIGAKRRQAARNEAVGTG